MVPTPPSPCRNSTTSVLAPCRAAPIPAGAPPVPPPMMTVSYFPMTGTDLSNDWTNVPSIGFSPRTLFRNSPMSPAVTGSTLAAETDTFPGMNRADGTISRCEIICASLRGSVAAWAAFVPSFVPAFMDSSGCCGSSTCRFLILPTIFDGVTGKMASDASAWPSCQVRSRAF